MRLRYTVTALRQIEQVLSYVEARSTQGAANIRQRILTAAVLVQGHPYAGQATTRPSVRRVVLSPYPYILFYRITGDEIIVMRLRHSARRP